MTERKPISANQEITVEIVYGANRVDFFDANEDPILESTYLEKNRIPTLEKAMDVYLDLGPGLHTLDESPAVRAHKLAIQAISKKLPRQVINAGVLTQAGSDDSELFTYFGNLSVRGRQATDEEKEQSLAGLIQQREKDAAALREACTAKDAKKENILQYDHTFFTVDEQAYCLNLDRQPAMLAYRALEYVRNVPPGDNINWDNFDQTLWDQMTTAEKAMLDITEAEVYRQTGAPITKLNDRIVSDLLRPLGLVDKKQPLRTDRLLKIRLRTFPEPDNYQDRAITIAPPGAPKKIFASIPEKSDPAAQEKLEEDTKFLNELVFSSNAWTQNQAIQALDIVMTREGKQAVLNMFPDYQEERRQAKAEEQLNDIHRRARRALQAGYYDVIRQRTIAGNHLLSSGEAPVRQTGGIIDLSTTTGETLRYWSIGRPRSFKNT